jgi:hypothetical protein
LPPCRKRWGMANDNAFCRTRRTSIADEMRHAWFIGNCQAKSRIVLAVITLCVPSNVRLLAGQPPCRLRRECPL